MISIQFFVYCESDTFVWNDVKVIPHINEHIIFNETLYTVRDVIWESNHLIKVIIER